MKIRFLALPLALVVALNAVTLAQTAPMATPSVTVPISTPPDVPLSKSASKSWLDARGILSVEELAALLGAEFSPAQRAQLQSALAARNAALERANNQLAAQLNQILGQGETQITARIEAKTARDSDDARMERLKRLQPSRYQELMRRKRAQEAKKGE